MFDTIGATGEQTGIIFYVVWLLLSRWLVVAMVVTVLFYRIDVDTGEYLRIAAKNSMRSVFALEHAFMQVQDTCSKPLARVAFLLPPCVGTHITLDSENNTTERPPLMFS